MNRTPPPGWVESGTLNVYQPEGRDGVHLTVYRTGSTFCGALEFRGQKALEIRSGTWTGVFELADRHIRGAK